MELAEAIIRDLRSAEAKDLQERLLEAMFMMERYRGAPCTGIECVPNVLEADVSAPTIRRLADALEEFIRTHPQHPDVGSAVWALGSLRDSRHMDLFTSISAPGSGYTDWAKDQASSALSYMYERQN